MKKIELVSKAKARYVRVSPRKVREVLNLIRGENVLPALATLGALNKRVKVPVEKVLRSAISNAQQNPEVRAEDLFISKIIADKGPTLKRFRAAAMGRAVSIRHRTTHLQLELSRVKRQAIEKDTKIKAKRKVKK